MKHGVLHCKFLGTGGGSSCLQLVVSTSLRTKILTELHSGVTSGHLGQDYEVEGTLGLPIGH